MFLSRVRDRLAREGLRVEHAYLTIAQCSPSRLSTAIAETPVELVRCTVDLNLTGTMLTVKHGARVMALIVCTATPRSWQRAMSSSRRVRRWPGATISFS